jgi:soluble lytic murein transglycosylase-like protein
MVALILAVASLAAAPSSRPRHADPVARWNAIIDEAAARARLPQAWIRRVIRAESGGQPTLVGRPIRSRAGAMGLMQLMPATWSDLRAELALGRDPFDPHDNIVAGAMFLRKMYDRFGYPGLFGAYNAGPGRYRAHLRGAALPAETRAYLVAVAGPGVEQAAPVDAARPALFVSRTGDSGTAPAALPQPSPVPALFAIRYDPGPARAGDDRAGGLRPPAARLGSGLGGASPHW